YDKKMSYPVSAASWEGVVMVGRGCSTVVDLANGGKPHGCTGGEAPEHGGARRCVFRGDPGSRSDVTRAAVPGPGQPFRRHPGTARWTGRRSRARWARPQG